MAARAKPAAKTPQQIATAIQDDWDRKATEAAIAASKAVVSEGINTRASVGSLSDIEWGWIVAAAIFGWIKTKAQQAVAETRGYDEVIYTAAIRDPAPWEAGAVETILPQLGALQDVDWNKPVGAWSKAEIVSFAWQIYKLTDSALADRDEGTTDKIVRFNRDVTARETSAAHGGALTTHNELKDEIPFLMTLDFNRTIASATDINIAVNAALDAGALSEQREAQRDYLGASAIGSECLRRIQYDWKVESQHPARTKRIFERGHMFEEITVKAFAQAGFRMERGTPRTAFTAANGLFKGHCDGILVDGPSIEGLRYPCLWEHKALGASGWRKIEKDGLRKAYPHYYAQVQIYMAYLGLDENPAVFTAVNSDNCEILHVPVEFDAEAAQAWSDRAVMVIRATAAGELLERIADKPTDWRCKMCGHRERCWEQP